MAQRANLRLFLCILPAIIWSAWHPHDWPTWWLETLPVFAGFVVLFIAGRRDWRLSTFAMVLAGLHMLLLLVGGHYTYARVPLGDWMREWMVAERNHYDRLGHVMQGFVPAIICREIVIRNQVHAKRGWRNFTILSFCLALSACYELLECAAALISKEASESFLGTQGDNWDTQADMFLAGIGAVIALVFFSRLHDRSMAQQTLRDRVRQVD